MRIWLLLSLLSTSVAGDDQWRSLFNGKDLTGWQAKIVGEPLGQDSKHTFRVSDGKLVVNYENYQRLNGKYGHLFFQQKYSHYRLRLEYRFIGEQLPDGAGWAYKNSGVMLHSQDPATMRIDQEFPVSVEGQFLGADQGVTRPTGNLCTPGTLVNIAGKTITDHCVESSSATYVDEQWVTAEFEVLGSTSIKHWINGELVLSYQDIRLDTNDDDAKKLVSGGGVTELSEGYIALQSESHPIEFRNIAVKVLESQKD